MPAPACSLTERAPRVGCRPMLYAAVEALGSLAGVAPSLCFGAGSILGSDEIVSTFRSASKSKIKWIERVKQYSI